MLLWRISEFPTLDGEGGKLFAGRWHSKGNAVCYTSDHPASCLCEMLVHVDMNSLPDSFQLLRIESEFEVFEKMETLESRMIPSIEITREIGDHWLKENKSAILRVPSAILPEAFNYLINPMHSDFIKIKIDKILRVPLDPRLK